MLALLGKAQANDVTYEQILVNPDDLQLNCLYARQQVIKGNLQQSSTALERVLLIQPNWDNARLFYALVLYRLGDMAGANRELTILSDRLLPPAQQREGLFRLLSAHRADRPFLWRRSGLGRQPVRPGALQPAR